MKLALGLTLTTLLLAACGPGAGPPGPSGAKGTISGQVLAWPCAPVERVGSPCPGRPAPDATVQVTPAGGGPASEVVTDGMGDFSVMVPPGRYQVAVVGRRLVGTTSVAVDVEAGGTATADLVIDSGIR